MRLCSIQGCGNAWYKRQWCCRHYTKWWKYGDPLVPDRRAPNGAGNLHQGYRRHHRDGESHREHVVIAARALGRPLPAGAIVHHTDENPINNAPANLVICPSRAYHNLLHRRIRAIAICGHADWRLCNYCKTYDAPEAMYVSARHAYHRSCERGYKAKRAAKTKRSFQ